LFLPSYTGNAGKVLALNSSASDVQWISAGGVGTVTSIDISGGTTGLTTFGGPITAAGTITLGGTLAVANGGTGATTATAARTNLGATTVGSNMFSLTNPSAITFPRFNADNTVSALDAGSFRTAIGAGTSSTTGTVTSVSGAGTVNGLTLTGTVTASGSLTLGGTLDLSSPPAIGSTAANSGAFTTLSGNAVTSVTPVLSFNASNTIASFGTTTASSYNQLVIQNKSSTAGASTNYVLSNDSGTDSTYYGEFGMNSSAYSASTPADYFSINNGVYFSAHDGDVTIGSGNGYKTYLAWGTTGQSAHVINATGALGFSTSLGTTPALSGTTGFGTSGQALRSGGSAAAPSWGTLGTAGGGTGLTSFTANGVVYASSTSALTTGSALTFDGTTLTAGTVASIQINSANYVGASSFGVRYNASNARLGISIANANGFPYIGYNTNNKNGSDTPTYDLTQAATQFRMDSGQFIWNRADSGTAGTDITWSEQMRLTSTGLGIGTSSPAYKLDVQGGSGTLARFTNTTANQSVNVQITAGTNSHAYQTITRSNVSYDAQQAWIPSGALSSANPQWGAGFSYNDSGNNWKLVTYDGSSTVDRMVVTSAGNLGFGVTPSAWTSYKAIQIGATGAASFASSNSSEATIFANAYLNSGTFKYVNSVAASYYSQSSGAHAWAIAASGTAGTAITFTQAMTLDASGKLGIGATSPNSFLHVKGGNNNVANIDNTGGQYTNIAFSNNGTEKSAIYWDNSNSLFYFTAEAASSQMVFATVNTERARIDSSGNLFVGQTSGGRQDINGITLEPKVSGGGYAVFNHATGSGSGRQFQSFAYAGTEIGSITQAGTTGVLYNVTSDYRLKDIAGPVTNSGAFIDKLNPVQGSWKADGSRFIGFLAHELQEASETVVGTGVKDGEQMQSIDYSNAELIANMAAELKSLRKRLADAGIA
jgi:hypothetical protein